MQGTENISLSLATAPPQPSSAGSAGPSAVEGGFEHLFGKGKSFPYHLFKNTPVEEVDELPRDMDGKKVFALKLDGNLTYHQVIRDKRYFVMSQSRTKGCVFTKRIGHCQGGFACPNTSCVKLLCSETLTPNKSHFQNRNGYKACFSCGTPAIREPCPARKMAEQVEPGRVLVYHLGTHSCTPKPGPTWREELELRDRVRRDPLLTPKQIQKKDVGELITSGCISQARAEAKKVVHLDNIVKHKKEVVATNLQPNSFEAILALKGITDKADKCHVWKVNMDGQSIDPPFVFLFSTVLAKIAIQMDVNGERPCPLQEEDVYIDANHSRAQKLKSIATWVYHPSLRRVIRLAIMYCQHEDTVSLTLFWKLFNEVVAYVKGSPGYVFNPRAFMSDEHGGNKNAIRDVFGVQVSKKRHVTCAWHFTSNANKKAREVLKLPSDHDLFLGLCKELVDAHTVAKYQDLWADLLEMGEAHPGLKPFLTWWEARKYHIVPAFRKAGHPGVNLAEIGNSQWTGSHKMSLFEAVKDDLGSVYILEEDILSFDSGKAKSRGRGPNTHMKQAKTLVAQLKAAKEIKDIFPSVAATEACASEAYVDVAPLFKPSSRASHKAPKKDRGIQGKYVQTAKINTNLNTLIGDSSDSESSGTLPDLSPCGNSGPSPSVESASQKVESAAKPPRRKRCTPSIAIRDEPASSKPQQRSNPPKTNPSNPPSNPSKTKNRRRTTHELSSSDEENYTPPPKKRSRGPVPSTSSDPASSNTKERALMVLQGPKVSMNLPAGMRSLKEHSKVIPEIIPLGPRISICQGCKGKISQEKLKHPYNFVFKCFGDRVWRKAVGDERITRGNCYFHLDFHCVKLWKSEVSADDITMDTSHFDALDDAQLQVLHNLEYLGKIIKNQS